MDPLNYVKTKSVNWKTLEDSYISSNDEEIEYQYNPFSINNIQNYNPIYDLFFSFNEKTYNTISFNHPYHFQTTESVYDIENKCIMDRPVFIKYSPLLDPYRYMTGKYKNIGDFTILPKPSTLLTPVDPISPEKLQDTHNASYVDNFFSFLASRLIHQYKFPHSVDYYGSFLGVQELFKFNIIDDFEFLQSSDYYLDNVNKLFMVTKGEHDIIPQGSRANKLRIQLGGSHRHNFTVISIGEEGKTSELDGDSNKESIVDDGEVIYEKDITKTTDEKSSTSSESSSDDESESDSESEEKDGSEDGEGNSESESEWETESEEMSEFSEDPARYAYIKKFPIQMICLEKCDGTMDELFMKKQMTVEKGASALFQVIMTLIMYQKLFQFTHNDLHTNNIMYTKTDRAFLYYKWKGQVYKVPTYGKIFKIIDFGRSIYRYNGRIFCSDSFSTGGDASTQYNTEPYFNENKARVDPNYSFDLCRLGCSIYDFIIDYGDDVKEFNDLQRTINRWCTNDNGKNILYKQNGEERYPGFKLYRMIAKSVHQHTPERQLEFDYFNQFLVKGKKELKKIKDDIIEI